MGEEKTSVVTHAGRTIIRRPRLEQQLDEAGARILLLVAPAGYGKTTLARHWLGEAGRRSAWYRGGPAAADVAALALGIAQSATVFLPEADRRITERLRVSNEPAREYELLAELLAEDLAGWPEGAWLCVDDYHFATEAEEAEQFFDLVATLARLPLLVTTRQRPSWATARRILYGEIFELGRNALAFTPEEATEVLLAGGRSDARGLIQLADGWPAMLGLAALTEEAAVPEKALPEALYNYFAEELYRRVGPELQEALFKLGLVQAISPRDAAELLGEGAGELLQSASTLGFMTGDQDGAVSMHRLLRSFLQEKLKTGPRNELARLVREAAAFHSAREHWDEAFDLVQRFDVPTPLPDMLSRGLQLLLAGGRVRTIARWLKYAAAKHVYAPVCELAAAELALRRGDYDLAETLAMSAIETSSLDDEQFRARLVAARAAHLTSNERRALRHLGKAVRQANQPADLEEALYLRLITHAELESLEAERVLTSLRNANSSSPEAKLRLAIGEGTLSSFRKSVRPGIAYGLKAVYFFPRVTDPMIRSNFLNRLGYLLTVAGRYGEALTYLKQAFAEARTYRLAFAIPHIELALAEALLGMRHFSQAATLIRHVVDHARSAADPFLAVCGATTHARLNIALHCFDDALSLTRAQPDQEVTRLAQAEYFTARALALACAGRIEDSQALLDAARKLTRSTVLSTRADWVQILGLLHKQSEESSVYLQSVFASLSTTGHIDAFVSTYRGCPDLIDHLALGEQRPALVAILRSSNDHGLAARLQPSACEAPRRTAPLTRREVEVLDLIRQGLSNREIGGALFISESTAKVHVRHILRKLGARSRADAAARHLLDESLLSPLRLQSQPDESSRTGFPPPA